MEAAAVFFAGAGFFAMIVASLFESGLRPLPSTESRFPPPNKRFDALLASIDQFVAIEPIRVAH